MNSRKIFDDVILLDSVALQPYIDNFRKEQRARNAEVRRSLYNVQLKVKEILRKMNKKESGEANICS